MRRVPLLDGLRGYFLVFMLITHLFGGSYALVRVNHAELGFVQDAPRVQSRPPSDAAARLRSSGTIHLPRVESWHGERTAKVRRHAERRAPARASGAGDTRCQGPTARLLALRISRLIGYS